MERSEILLTIKRFIAEYKISKDELLGLYENSPAPAEPPTVQAKPNNIGLLDLVAYVGGVIVVLGIFILLALNWGNFNSITRVLITLGSAVCAYVVGVLVHAKLPKISPVFFLIAGLTLPFGVNSVFQAFGLDTTNNAAVITGLAVITLSVMLVMYAIRRQLILLTFVIFDAAFLFFALGNWFVATIYTADYDLLVVLAAIFAFYLISRRLIFIAFALIDATMLFFNLGATLLTQYSGLNYPLLEYQSLIVGLSYLLLAYYFATRKTYKKLSGLLYNFGSLIFLGSALTLGGWTPDHTLMWEIITPFLIAGTLYFSLKLNRNSLLVWGMLFLVAYVVKISSEYFSGFGWPVALIIAGLLIILSSSTVLYIRSKKLSPKLSQKV